MKKSRKFISSFFLGFVDPGAFQKKIPKGDATF